MNKVSRLLVPLLMLLGILFALVKEVVFADYYGVGRQLEIFRVGYALPNLMSFSVGTSFVAVAVPYLVRSTGSKLDDSSAVCSVAIANLIVILAMVLPIWVFASEVGRLMAPGFNSTELVLLVRSLKLNCIMFFFIGLTWSLRAILNTKEVFWPGASVSAIKSLVFIAYFLIIGESIHLTARTDDTLEILAVSSGLLILISHIAPFVWSVNSKAKLGRIGWSFRIRLFSGVKGLLFGMSTVVVFQLLNIGPVFLDRAYASGMSVGTIASVDYSYSVLIALGTILASAYNMLTLPSFSRAVLVATNVRELKIYFLSALMIVLVSAFVGIFIYLYAGQLVTTLLERGAFDQQASALTEKILKWMGIGLGFMVANLIVFQCVVVFLGYRYLIVIGLVKLGVKFAILETMVGKLEESVFGISFIIVEFLTLVLLSIVAINVVGKGINNTPVCSCDNREVSL